MYCNEVTHPAIPVASRFSSLVSALGHPWGVQRRLHQFWGLSSDIWQFGPLCLRKRPWEAEMGGDDYSWWLCALQLPESRIALSTRCPWKQDCGGFNQWVKCSLKSSLIMHSLRAGACCCREASRCFPCSELEHIQLQSGFWNTRNGHLVTCNEDSRI